MSTLASVTQRGLRSAQPAATAVPVGTLYYVTDETVIERSTGAAWQSYSAAVSAGKLIQVVNTQTGAVATGTTVIPHDDSIPQNGEGDQYMSLAITPTSAANKLKIDVVIYLSATNASEWLAAALFQDSTASALAAGTVFDATATAIQLIAFTHYMTAGTTSATTFKVRAGRDSAGTTTFNGASGGRILGGVMASSITISEIIP